MKSWLTSITLSLLGVGAYLLFKDTMNRIQYIKLFGNRYLYWITRDIPQNVRFVGRGFMRTTQAPWLRGYGVIVRWSPSRSTQVGFAREAPIDSLLEQLDGRVLPEVDIDKIRDEWVGPHDYTHEVYVDDDQGPTP